MSRHIRPEKPTTRQLKVLVIEDEEKVRQMFKNSLEPMYAVHLAEDGKEGLRLAESVQPAIILLDIMMPGMDGLTVLARLKARSATRKIPVIIVSARGETNMLLKGQEAVAVDYLIKPFDLDVLNRLLARHLIGA